MDHEHALRVAAVEKYLLNELAQEERDEFEEHFFDCQECTLDLRAGAAFLSQAKKDFTRRAALPAAEKKPRQGWLGFFLKPAAAIPAFAALLFALVYQNAITFPRLKHEVASQNAPQVLPALSLMAANTRGGETVSLRTGRKPFLLVFDIPSGDASFVNYICSLYSPSGSLLWQTTVSPEQAKDTISLRVPPVAAGDGTYSLLVQGNKAGSAVDLARYHFRLEQD